MPFAPENAQNPLPHLAGGSSFFFMIEGFARQDDGLFPKHMLFVSARFAKYGPVPPLPCAQLCLPR